MSSLLLNVLRPPLIRMVRFMRQCRRLLKLIELRVKGCEVDWSATVHPSAVLERSGGRISIGARCYIDRGAILRALGGHIEIGTDCAVNAYSFLSGSGGLRMGNCVMVGSHVSMYASDHEFSDLAVPMARQGLVLGRIDIEDDVWVGTGVRILAGVRVETGSVLAAGAVVTKSTAPYSINGGVPARQIGTRLADGSAGQVAAVAVATEAGVSGD